ncbi:MAG: hypothetical protein JWM89_1386 [Acidimicrobiales bacterium]|nr:hypothetical protein [Acidimicrobiales bacterium]
MPDTTMIVIDAGTQPGMCCSNGVVLTRWLTPAMTKPIPSRHCAERRHRTVPDRILA